MRNFINNALVKRALVKNILGVALFTLTLVACTNDDNKHEDNFNLELPQKRAFILNEGKWAGNNSGVAFFAPYKDAENAEDNFIANLFKLQNGQELGDVAQDIITYNNSLYVTVYGSNLLLKLNAAGVEQARLSFTEADGKPRNLVAQDDKIYVTLQGGKVARLNAETLAIEKRVDVGSAPESVVSLKGKLYVANAGQGLGSTVSVIDIATFTEEKQLEVLINPNLLLVANDEVYLISWGDLGTTIPYTLQRIMADGTVERITEATHFAQKDGIIYLMNSVVDWASSTAVNYFFTYDTKTHTLNTDSPFTEMPEDMKNAILYSINIDAESGEVYITTSSFTSNGDVYRFSADGAFMEKFDSGGINPKKVVFLKE